MFRLLRVGGNDIDQSLQGRAFNKPPTAGSVASQVRSIADRNEALGLPPVSANAPEAFVTKYDASDAQHEESRIYGGQNPRGGMAAQMQVGRTAGRHQAPTTLFTDTDFANYEKSAADKLGHARRDS